MARLPQESRRHCVDEMVRLYTNGSSSTEIAGVYALDPSTVRGHLKRRGVELRDASSAHRAYALNEHAFECNSAEAHYWLGFLLADGCVRREGQKSYCVELSLAECDRGHVERFREFVGSNSPIRIKNRNNDRGSYARGMARACIQLYSGVLGQSLIQRGVVPHKTEVATVPDQLADDVDFWRGIVDGDGHMTSSLVAARLNRRSHRTYTIGIVGTQSVCDRFLEFAVRRVGPPPRECNSAPTAVGIYSAKVSGQRGLQLMKLLYAGDSVALPRKVATATDLLRLAGAT